MDRLVTNNKKLKATHAIGACRKEGVRSMCKKIGSDFTLQDYRNESVRALHSLIETNAFHAPTVTEKKRNQIKPNNAASALLKTASIEQDGQHKIGEKNDCISSIHRKNSRRNKNITTNKNKKEVEWAEAYNSSKRKVLSWQLRGKKCTSDRCKIERVMGQKTDKKLVPARSKPATNKISKNSTKSHRTTSELWILHADDSAHLPWKAEELQKLNELYWELKRPSSLTTNRGKDHILHYVKRHQRLFPHRDTDEIYKKVKYMLHFNKFKEKGEREYWESINPNASRRAKLAV